MFYSGVHSIILTSTSNLPQKLLQQNSNTCTSPNSYPNNNTLQTIPTETAPSVSPSVFSAWGSPQKKQFLVPAIHAEKLFSSDSVQILFHKNIESILLSIWGRYPSAKQLQTVQLPTNQLSNPFGLYQKQRPRQVTVSGQLKNQTHFILQLVNWYPADLSIPPTFSNFQLGGENSHRSF